MKLSHKYFKYHVDNLPDHLKSKPVHESVTDVIEWIEANVTIEKKSVEFVQFVVPYLGPQQIEQQDWMKPYFILRTLQID